ncbi:MAG: tRNA-dihydrouridine synthase family protein [Planctomycetes bacterium]|nr:tRNA-dihydrouridine synthase family protein [Planctomycetota bacterium]
MIEPGHIMQAMIALSKGPFDWIAAGPFFQAGLAGYSDAAMRLVARRHGCGYCITEAMLDQFLINGGKGLKAAEICEEDHPIAGQLMGSHPKDIAAGAKVLLTLGYDVIDINLACPVKKIKKKCRGGHLLSEPQEAIDILDAVRDAIGDAVPLTVKLRRAYDDTPEMEANFHRIFEKVIAFGYAGATVHGRTVEQKYIGPSRWPFLTDLTRRYRSAMDNGFHIFGSGDVFTPQAIFDMIQQTGVQAASVARGCIGNPWIFRQARQIMAGQTPTPPTLAEQRAVLLEHFQLSVDLHGESNAGRMMRKFGIKFSQHHPNGDAVKNAFIAVKNLADWHAALDAHYPMGETTDEIDATWIDEADRRYAEVRSGNAKVVPADEALDQIRRDMGWRK